MVIKDHGMLYKAEMARRLLDQIEPKTQTRRPITFDNSTTDGMVSRKEWPDLIWGEAELDYDNEQDCPLWLVPWRTIHVRVYPRIRKGDIIWVKETWAAPHKYDHLPPRLIPHDANIHYSASEKLGGLMKRVSIFMLRWASRIDLKVLKMRSQRIKDICPADAIAEGIKRSTAGTIEKRCFDEIYSFRTLWDVINISRGYAWDDNHPVWIHDFERIKQK